MRINDCIWWVLIRVAQYYYGLRTTIHRRSASTTYTVVSNVCEVILVSMKLITGLILICFAMETVHCSRSWNLWDYLKKKATLDRSSIDTEDDHGVVMPLQVRIMQIKMAAGYVMRATSAGSAGSVTGRGVRWLARGKVIVSSQASAIDENRSVN